MKSFDGFLGLRSILKTYIHQIPVLASFEKLLNEINNFWYKK